VHHLLHHLNSIDPICKRVGYSLERSYPCSEFYYVLVVGSEGLTGMIDMNDPVHLLNLFPLDRYT